MIGKRIQSLRKEQGLSQEDLATNLVVSRQAISKWELGESIPDTENIVQLSRLFNVSTDFLLTGEDKSDIDSVDDIPAVTPPETNAGQRLDRWKTGLIYLLALAFLVMLSLYFREIHSVDELSLRGTFVDRDQGAHGAVHLVFARSTSGFAKYRVTTDDGTFMPEMLDYGNVIPVNRRYGLFSMISERHAFTAQLVYANERIYWPNGDGTFTVFYFHHSMPIFIHVRAPWYRYPDEPDYDPHLPID